MKTGKVTVVVAHDGIERVYFYLAGPATTEISVLYKGHFLYMVWLFRLGNGAIHLGDEPDPRCPRVGI